MKSVKTQFAVNLLSIVSACAAIYFDFTDNSILYTFFKPLTTILIMSLLLFVKGTHALKFKNIIIAALIFCLLGDILLLWDDYFVLGLASFLIGHLLFATGFIKLRGFHFNWVSFIIFFAIGAALLVWLKPDLEEFELPVTIYVLVITFMAWQGIGLFLEDQKIAYVFIALAVVLFMFSDTMIAVDKFKSPFKLSGLVILSSYWGSILLTVNATYLITTKK
jgi:uncharacterized membrane protein YhhN